MPRWLGGCVAIAWVVAGCSDPATQLVVAVDTDYAVPSEIDRVRVEVVEAGGVVAREQVFDLAQTRVPFSFAVVPRDDDASRAVVLTFSALAPDGAARVTRRVETGFREGKSLLLRILLDRGCEGATCAAGETCVDGGSCGSPRIDPRSLPEAPRAGDELEPRDAGPRDGGADGGDSCSTRCLVGCDVQSCPTEGDCACVGCESCTLTCGDGASCMPRCNASPCTIGGLRTVGLSALCEAGATCAVDARMSMRARVRCEAGSSCTVNCSASTDCEVDCAAGAACVVNCSAAATGCVVSACGADGGVVECAAMVRACGTPCP